MFHKMPFVLVAVVLLILALDSVIPLEWKSAAYALSLTIKSGIICVLPFVIFMLLFKTLAQLTGEGTKMIAVILAAVCISNFFSTMISYEVASTISSFDLSIAMPKGTTGLTPAWNFTFPQLIPNDKAMFGGLILGILASFFTPGIANRVARRFDVVVDYLLNAIVMIIPLFITGFAVKLIHDKVMESIVRDYSIIFILVGVTQVTYVSLVYLACNDFNLKRFINSIKIMSPAGIAAFGSMSSAAAMPITMLATEKNTNNPTLTRLAIPTTANIHLVGDCIAIPVFAFAILHSFGLPDPSFSTYLIFALYFVLAKFSVAAVPGGGILVMLPVLEANLGFNSEMSSLVTALYVLFDPVSSFTNVMANGAFTMVLNKVQNFFSSRGKAATTGNESAAATDSGQKIEPVSSTVL